MMTISTIFCYGDDQFSEKKQSSTNQSKLKFETFMKWDTLNCCKSTINACDGNKWSLSEYGKHCILFNPGLTGP